MVWIFLWNNEIKLVSLNKFYIVNIYWFRQLKTCIRIFSIIIVSSQHYSFVILLFILSLYPQFLVYWKHIKTQWDMIIYEEVQRKLQVCNKYKIINPVVELFQVVWFSTVLPSTKNCISTWFGDNVFSTYITLHDYICYNK